MPSSRLRFALLTVLALAGLNSPTAAGGIALRWTNCIADGGTSNVAFACNTNTGFRALVPSFTLDTPVDHVASVLGVVDVVANGSVLPEWWQLSGCRSGSVSATLSSVGPVACQLWTTLFIRDGINSYVTGATGPNTAQLTFSSVLGSPVASLAAGTEYIVTALRINLNRTVGSPSCGGCQEGACLTLRSLVLTTSSGPVQLTLPGPTADAAHVTWQGGGAGPGGSCSIASPVRRSTWGAVRSLYR